MQVQVVWQKKAIHELDSATNKGRSMFGERVAARFFYEIKAHDSLLETNPYLGQRMPQMDTPRRQFRSLVVHEHYRLIYYVDEKKQLLYVVSLWDTRRDPVSLAYHIQGKK